MYGIVGAAPDVKVTLEYDGTGFSAGVIRGADWGAESALRSTRLPAGADGGRGRNDAGRAALGQVASLEAEAAAPERPPWP